MNKLTLLTLIGFLCLCSCKSKIEGTYLKNASLHTGFQKAGQQKKGLLLISSKSGCSMCEMFDIDLMKDEDYAQSIYENFVILRVDDNEAGAKWLNRILNGPGVPTFLFFSPDQKLMALKIGAMDKKQMQLFIKKIKNNEQTFDPRYRFGKGNTISIDKVAPFLDNLFKAQIEFDKYSTAKDSNALSEMSFALKKTLIIQSSFYNNYLLSRFFAERKDTIQAKLAGERALLDEDPASLYFNRGLRTELKRLLNKSYTDYDDSYIGVDQVEKQLGKLKFGSSTSIVFNLKNMGKKDLLIQQVYPDCGCTIASYTKAKIKPNKTGLITLKFKADAPGEFTHMAYVQSNAVNGPTQLYIKGQVLGD